MHRRKPRLLIAGGGYADIPMIRAAKRLGYHVITSGNRPADLGHPYGDEVRLHDYSDQEGMLRLAETLRIDAVCASCNDFSALTASYVAERLGLPGHDPFETSLVLHHKDCYREFALANGVPTPYARGFTSADAARAALEEFEFPVLVKPVDLTGGKGIARVDEPARARDAIDRAFRVSRAKRVVVEEFVTGTRHGLSTFVRDGRVVFHFNDDEHYFLNPYLVSAASAPGAVEDAVVRRLVAVLDGIVTRLGLGTGILHVQYILGPEGPVIIEICRRPPGDLYVRLVELAMGVDYAGAIIGAAVGLPGEELVQVEPQGYTARHCMMTDRNGRVKDVRYHPEIAANVLEEFVWWRPGDAVEDYLNQKFGIVFLRFDSMAEMRDRMARMQELIHVEVQ